MGKMSREDLFREIGEIDEKYVEEAQRAWRSRRISPWVGRTLVTAASLILCVGVGYVALQLTRDGMSNMNSASGGSAMEAAQELYSMAEANDQMADGAAPEETSLEMEEAQQNKEAASAQAQVPSDTEAQAGGTTDCGTAGSLSEPREEGAESANRQQVQGSDSNVADEAGLPSPTSRPLIDSVEKMDTPMELSWEMARTDAAYGHYVDVQVPEGYSYSSGTRSEQRLHVIWHKGMTEEISISCQHADESVSDWLVDTDNPEEYDLGLYAIPWADSMPGELRQKIEGATFRSDQISQEIVTARSYQVEGDQGDVSGWRTRIAILYSDNVLVEIRSKGPSPEEIYALINLEN
ncbi:MAG: hypothetical protein K2K19_01580 [Acetatifactor sp.]|nr:hypothetical protein [Acetatifactor sp.]